MADPLCYLKELALKEINPKLFTIATLTGHAARTYGDNYTVNSSIAEKLQALGEEVGDPFEISTVRREVCFISINLFYQSNDHSLGF